MKRNQDGFDSVQDPLAPKKSLGQNFLNSAPALMKMVAAADIKKNDCVLEIGPGKGALTERLLKAGARVVALEKDTRLIPFLEEKFKAEIESGALTVIKGDALEIDPESFFVGESYKLVANIPYYITGQLLRRFLSEVKRPERAVVLLQREVAQRIVAADRKESLLSLSVKAYGKARIVSVVKAGSFFPKPNVDSAILSIESISDDFFQGFSEEEYFALLHVGFAQKRKMLRGNLETLYARNAIEKALENAKLPLTARAEDLSLEQWAQLAQSFKEIPSIQQGR